MAFCRKSMLELRVFTLDKRGLFAGTPGGYRYFAAMWRAGSNIPFSLASLVRIPWIKAQIMHYLGLSPPLREGIKMQKFRALALLE